MPVYNAEEFLSESINSILRQTYSNFELIIVNDGSTDASLHKINGVDDDRLKLYDLSFNQGVSYCRNFAIDMAAGEYIAFCDADDKWAPTKLEKQLSYMQYNNLKISGTRVKNFRNGQNTLYDRPFNSRIRLEDMLIINTLVMSSVMLSSDFLKGIKFDRVRHEDFDMWLRILKFNTSVICSVDEVLVFCRRHDSALTSNKFKMLWWRYLVLRKNQYGIIRSIILIFLRLFYGR